MVMTGLISLRFKCYKPLSLYFGVKPQGDIKAFVDNRFVNDSHFIIISQFLFRQYSIQNIFIVTGLTTSAVTGILHIW